MKNKHSKFIAMLVLSVMLFGFVQPVFARTWGEFFTETAAGMVVGGIAGGALVFFTGGAAIPFIVGGVAAGGAIGAAPEEKRVEVAIGIASLAVPQIKAVTGK